MAGGKIGLTPSHNGQEIRQKLIKRFVKELGSSLEKGLPFIGTNGNT